MPNPQKYYFDVTTAPEWILRIGLGFSGLSLLCIPLLEGSYVLVPVGLTVLFITLCLAWNDQYELSEENGLVLSRTLFGKENRKCVRDKNQLTAVTLRAQRRLIKTGIWYRWRTYYQSALLDTSGKKFPVGPHFPNILAAVLPDWERAKHDAGQVAEEMARALGLEYQALS